MVPLNDLFKGRRTMSRQATNAPTKVYGCSDDLIEFEGGFTGEVGCYGTTEKPIIFIASDGTIFTAQYAPESKPGGIWALQVLKQGTLFDRLEICLDENADPYSDIIFFHPGVVSVLFAPNFQWVR